VLLFTRGATTDRVWFYDMAHDGFSLDDKRQPVPENDIPDILDCWRHRYDADFQTARPARLEALRAQVAPLKAERLKLQAEINRLTFESVIAEDPKGFPKPLGSANDELADLDARIAPLQAQMDQLTRQFWVTREQVKANKYDLSASRYRQVEQDEAYYEKPQVTLERLLELERVMGEEVRELERLLE
ncbi:MAG: N-6 DNA methylase, partial [Anaerolineae bacterium]|nr:N-6 DNA methylase [Anaerolineae bacterium]